MASRRPIYTFHLTRLCYWVKWTKYICCFMRATHAINNIYKLIPYSIRLPRRVAGWVNYSRQWTESSDEHYVSDLGLLKADAHWYENKWCSDLNPRPMDPKASELPKIPQCPTSTVVQCRADGGNQALPDGKLFSPGLVANAGHGVLEYRSSDVVVSES